MKKIIFLTLAVVFFGLASSQTALALSGDIKADSTSVPAGTLYKITISAFADPEKSITWLHLVENRGAVYIKNYYYNCIDGTEVSGDSVPFLSGKPTSRIGSCSHTWELIKDFPSVYVYKAEAVECSTCSFISPRWIPPVGGAKEILVAVTGTADTPLATADLICGATEISPGTKMQFTDKDGVTKDANSWCTADGQEWIFCNGNDSYHFGCKGDTPSNCDTTAATVIKNNHVDCPKPAAPAPVSPISDFDFPLSGKLTWEKVSDPLNGRIANYEWEVYSAIPGPIADSMGEFVGSGHTVSGSVTSGTLPPLVKRGESYFWRVRAITTDGRMGPWSMAPEFKTSGSAGYIPVPGVPGFTDCPTEGLVPCGTPDCPCQFCHFFVMTNIVLKFAILELAPIIAVLLLVFGGALFLFGGAKPSTLMQAKGIITSVVIGLLLIFSAWIIVNTALTMSGIISSPSVLKWHEVSCRF